MDKNEGKMIPLSIVRRVSGSTCLPQAFDRPRNHSTDLSRAYVLRFCDAESDQLQWRRTVVCNDYDDSNTRW